MIQLSYLVTGAPVYDADGLRVGEVDAVREGRIALRDALTEITREPSVTLFDVAQVDASGVRLKRVDA